MNGRKHGYLKTLFISALLCITVAISGCSVSVSSPSSGTTVSTGQGNSGTQTSTSTVDLDSIPAYSGSPYVAINDNTPYFESSNLTTEAFETYSDLDSLGRCGVAYANICTDLMPTEERGNISSIHPSGWQSVQYDNVDGGSLYNRCHLIAFQLAGENANEKNLITGTRYMNTQGMLPFENMVADYVKEEDAHVLYRVTPIFEGDELVARGVLMEAESVEDEGDSILFCVYCYNVQPGIEIDYSDGSSKLADSSSAGEDTDAEEYILNTNTMKFHKPSCPSVDTITVDNKKTVTESREELINEGYSPCGRCKP